MPEESGACGGSDDSLSPWVITWCHCSCPCTCLGADAQHIPGGHCSPHSSHVGGCWGPLGYQLLFGSHTSSAQTWLALKAFSLFFNNPCIHPKELWHWHMRRLSRERRGMKTTAPRQAVCLSCSLLIPTGREASTRCAGQEFRCD